MQFFYNLFVYLFIFCFDEWGINFSKQIPNFARIRTGATKFEKDQVKIFQIRRISNWVYRLTHERSTCDFHISCVLVPSWGSCSLVHRFVLLRPSFLGLWIYQEFRLLIFGFNGTHLYLIHWQTLWTGPSCPFVSRRLVQIHDAKADLPLLHYKTWQRIGLFAPKLQRQHALEKIPCSSFPALSRLLYKSNGHWPTQQAQHGYSITASIGVNRPRIQRLAGRHCSNYLWEVRIGCTNGWAELIRPPLDVPGVASGENAFQAAKFLNLHNG